MEVVRRAGSGGKELGIDPSHPAGETDTPVTVTAPPLEGLGELEPVTGPLLDPDGRVRLSFSRMDSYRNCPRKFRYAYIDRIPSVPSPHLSFGSSIHRALEAFYDRKLPSCPTVDELLGMLYEHWESSGFTGLSREEQVEFYRHAQQVLRSYHQRVSTRYRLPVTTEAWFEVPFETAVVVGSIDRIDRDEDGGIHVVDYKTNRRAQPRHRVAGSLQLAVYALACEHLFGELPATVALDFVVAGVEVRVAIDELDLAAARNAVSDTAAAVRSGRFEPTPNRLCDWCDYRDICPAWPDTEEGDSGEGALGPAVARIDELRRTLRREVRELRELEAGVERVRRELADDPS